MLENIILPRVLFLDIETVPLHASYHQLDDRFKKLWDKKAALLTKSETDPVAATSPESVYERAGIYAEFGKIICISTGYIKDGGFRIKSFYGDDEKQLLTDFAALLTTHFNTVNHYLCAHNGKEFDYPFIARRMLVNGIKLPMLLNIAGKKPWEITHLDTMELWKFGDYKNYTSLELLAALFGIPTPKNDIDGSQVRRVYYEEKDLNRIVEYCQKDTLTVAQLLLCYMGEEMIGDDEVVVV
ncbi:MAG: 3'-5' exonuclease [Bacteroidetes bacterium]|nr:3'-5' exonuclease [Bacteroidota bacterium]